MMARRLEELEREYRLRWEYATHYHRTSKNQPLTFQDKPYLAQVYADQSINLIVMKAVQTGATEWALCETFSLCERGYNVFYVLPNFNSRNAFVANRIRMTINNTDHYRAMAKEPREKQEGAGKGAGLFHFGNAAMRFASSETPRDFDEFDADCWIVDDYHNCDPENLHLCDDRISASSLKARRRIGIPILPEQGIHAEFLQSDQKEWEVPCPHCGHWQTLDFFTQVVVQESEGRYELQDSDWDVNSGRDIQVYCTECHKPLDRLANGRWEPRTESPISGYHLSKMMAPTSAVSELWQKLQKGMANDTVFQTLMNRDLGLPYEGAGDARLTDGVLNDCARDYTMPHSSEGPCSMGVDVGKRALHVRISEWQGETRKAVCIGTVPGFKELSSLMKRYNVRACVVDANPETRKAVEFQGGQPKGRVWLCEYPNWGTEKKMQKILLNRKEGIVQVDRTQTMDDVLESYVMERTHLPQNAASVRDFYAHMKAPQRVIQERAGKPVAVWVHSVPDDYYHADNYDNIARELFKHSGSSGRAGWL